MIGPIPESSTVIFKRSAMFANASDVITNMLLLNKRNLES